MWMAGTRPTGRHPRISRAGALDQTAPDALQGIRDITPHDLLMPASWATRSNYSPIVSRDFPQTPRFARRAPLPASGDHPARIGGWGFQRYLFEAPISPGSSLLGPGPWRGTGRHRQRRVSDIADSVVALRVGAPPVICEEDAATYARLGSGIAIASLTELPAVIPAPERSRTSPAWLAEVARALADHKDLPSRRWIQHEPRGATATLIVTTHAVQRAVWAPGLPASQKTPGRIGGAILAAHSRRRACRAFS